MEGFTVCYSRMKAAGGDMDDYAGKIQQYREDVLDIKNHLRGKISASDQIGRRLRNIANEMDNLGASMDRMGYAAEDICLTYHKAENAITADNDQIMKVLTGGKDLNDHLKKVQKGVKHGTAVAHLADYFRQGNMRVVEKDGYYIVKGLKDLRGKDSNLKNIKGTRYKIGSQKFNESGLNRLVPAAASPKIKFSKFLSNMKDGQLWKDTYKDFGNKTFKFQKGDVLGNIGKGLSYAGIALKAGTNAYENIKGGASGAKVAADLTTDVAKGLAGMAVASGCAKIGAAIGTAIPIPVVGTVVGAAAGFVLGYAGTKVFNAVTDGVKIGGKSLAGWVSTGLERTFDDIGKRAQSAVNDTRRAINGFISGFGKFAFG